VSQTGPIPTEHRTSRSIMNTTDTCHEPWNNCCKLEQNWTKLSQALEKIGTCWNKLGTIWTNCHKPRNKLEQIVTASLVTNLGTELSHGCTGE